MRRTDSCGGTQLLEGSGSYPELARKLFRELGVDTQRFYKAFHHDLYRSLGLSHGTFSFETFERNIRDQLGRVLGAGGFDPARDIADITVNRWPHGYTYGYDPATDRVAFQPDSWPVERQHWRRARQRFGNISMAASDAAANAMTESAIEEAHRAVSELT